MTVQTPPRPRGGPGAVIVAGLLVALVALVLAQLGMTALYAVLGLVAVGVVLRLLRDDLQAPVTERLTRLWRRRSTASSREHRSGRSTRSGAVLTVLATVGAAAVAWVVATQGGKAIGALVALLVVGLLALLLWPLVVELVGGRPGESAH
ncbi:MAG: hypothetical protein ABI336_00870, partial [Humibacillus sp.]